MSESDELALKIAIETNDWFSMRGCIPDPSTQTWQITFARRLLSDHAARAEPQEGMVMVPREQIVRWGGLAATFQASQLAAEIDAMLAAAPRSAGGDRCASLRHHAKR